MRINSKLDEIVAVRGSALAAPMVNRLAAANNDDDGESAESEAPSSSPRREDLPYKVELWDPSKSTVEQVLAVTRNGSIGYAAYYEATRQFPNRYITLRHNGRILSRFNGPTH